MSDSADIEGVRIASAIKFRSRHSEGRCSVNIYFRSIHRPGSRNIPAGQAVAHCSGTGKSVHIFKSTRDTNFCTVEAVDRSQIREHNVSGGGIRRKVERINTRTAVQCPVEGSAIRENEAIRAAAPSNSLHRYS